MSSATVTKRSKPRPNRRQQSLVFVDPFTDPKETRLPQTKRLVKKWSMLNRKNDDKPDQDDKADENNHNFTVPSQRSHFQTGNSFYRSKQQKKSGSREKEQLGTNWALQDPEAAALATSRSLRVLTDRCNNDPFNTLPITVNGKAFWL